MNVDKDFKGVIDETESSVFYLLRANHSITIEIIIVDTFIYRRHLK